MMLHHGVLATQPPSLPYPRSTPLSSSGPPWFHGGRRSHFGNQLFGGRAGVGGTQICHALLLLAIVPRTDAHSALPYELLRSFVSEPGSPRRLRVRTRNRRAFLLWTREVAPSLPQLGKGAYESLPPVPLLSSEQEGLLLGASFGLSGLGSALIPVVRYLPMLSRAANWLFTDTERRGEGLLRSIR